MLKKGSELGSLPKKPPWESDLYAQDQDKCISLLQKQSKSHFHSSQPFSDIHSSDRKTKSKKNVIVDLNSNQETKTPNLNAIIRQNNNNGNQEYIEAEKPNVLSQESDASTTHKSELQLPKNLLSKSSNPKVPLKPEVKSAPVISNHDRPFKDMCRNMPVSSHTIMCHMPIDQNTDNRMMFSTTKEHTVLPVESPRSKEPSSTSKYSEIQRSKRHAVSLSITPSFPFAQQQMNVYGGSVCTTASHSSRPGRHTTSLNLQLQPQSSDAYPVEISTIPTNIGSPCNYRDFGSHLQISVGSQGATFTALRLQRPHVSPTLSSPNQLPVTSQTSFNVSQSSSHAQDSKESKFPTHFQQVSNSVKENLELFDAVNRNFSKEVADKDHCINDINHNNLKSEEKISSKNLNMETNFLHGYQASPDYILAVKNHQKVRLNLVQEELSKEKAVCSNLKFEVNKLEQEITRKQHAEKNSFSYAEMLKKLKEENRKLALECNNLIMEYDLCSKDQTPISATDEDFYSNIFTGPNDGLTCVSGKRTKDTTQPQDKSKSSSEDDENSSWKCKSCTFVNHPALEKCEMCELPKGFGCTKYNPNYSTTSRLRLMPSTEGQPRRAVGSVQIKVTRRIPSNSKSVKLQLTHRMPR
ncbi:TGF-beta-activated kinase 1 and MAP3K7-binding protein 2 [Araneus ventricosus]|uniref:TGF-beta-activated kinase 1 and MAP3K7-binding protein 2 n=1 Tax=Araneus ventricosus TaxID=182803 RepID=A0A4Y2PAI1_ARAVE|nr:TGF-beta-activated kinase 1 and MAP3K7-binding protein 2 [Araneus ventricosus]